jgi:hypothetical protein
LTHPEEKAHEKCFSLPLQMPIQFEDNVKNPLVFPSRREKSTSFLNFDRIIHLLFPAAARSNFFWEDITD